MHLPGFLNPLTPFKNAINVATTVAKDVKDVALLPAHLVQDQFSVYNDVLHLDFKKAAKDEVKRFTEPASTGKSLIGNHVDAVKTFFKNMF
ncbi:MAG: hypothetical protein JWM80_597 [Cyanobacteria bacterium RYN_339]|nr:hypothetical protein [Cyanobacteria bacterium RYN_339]